MGAFFAGLAQYTTSAALPWRSELSEPPRQKPLSARPSLPGPGDARQGKVTPAVVARPADAHTLPAPGGRTEPDVSEVMVSGRGGAWTVSVLGRSGRAAARSAPLLLLGFAPHEAGGAAPTLEATVAGRALGELSDDVLQSALVRAVPPPTGTRRRPFFEDVDQGGRPSRDGGS